MPKVNELKIRINGTISDEPAQILLELKSRGLARSNMDAIGQALVSFYERVLERDTRAARLKTLTGSGSEG